MVSSAPMDKLAQPLPAGYALEVVVTPLRCAEFFADGALALLADPNGEFGTSAPHPFSSHSFPHTHLKSPRRAWHRLRGHVGQGLAAAHGVAWQCLRRRPL